MAKCPECGFNVSDSAYTCAKCGYVLTNGSNKEFEIKRTVTVPPAGSSRRRRRPGGALNQNSGGIEAIRAMLAAPIEETPAVEEAPVFAEPEVTFAEPVIEEAPVFVEPEVTFAEPIIEEAPVFVEPEVTFAEPVIEETPVFTEPEVTFAEPIIEEAPVFVEPEVTFAEPIVEEAPIFTAPAAEEREHFVDATPAIPGFMNRFSRSSRFETSAESISYIESLTKEEKTAEEEIQEPVIEESLVFVEPEVIAEEPVIEEAPVFVEPEVIVEEPVIEEAPIFVEPEVIVEEPVIEEAPVFVEPEVIAEEPVIEEAPVFVEPEVIVEEPIIEEAPIFVEPEVIVEEPVIEEAPIFVEPEVIVEEPVIEEPIVEEIYSSAPIEPEVEKEEKTSFKDIASNSDGKVDILSELRAEKAKKAEEKPIDKDETKELGYKFKTDYTEEVKVGRSREVTPNYTSELPKRDEIYDKIFGEEKKEKTDIKKNPAILAAIIAVVIALIMVMVVAIVTSFGGNRNSANMLIQKDTTIYSLNLGSAKQTEITSEAKSGSAESLEIQENAAYINADGSLMIYTDKTVQSDDGYTLYMKEADANTGSASLIDGGIYYYKVSEDFKTLIYLKSEGNSFLIKELGEDENAVERVETDIVFLASDSNCTRFLYLKENGNLFIKDNRSTPVLLSNNAKIEYFSEDLESIYYTENNKLYFLKWNDSPILISDSAIKVSQISKNGEVYFISENYTEHSLYDFIEDDSKAVDAVIKEPIKPEEPDLFPFVSEMEKYMSEEEYLFFIIQYEMGILDDALLEEYMYVYKERMILYEAELADYEKEIVKYEEKLQRDKLRKELKEATFERTYYSLNLYIENEVKTISNNVKLEETEPFLTEKCFISFYEYAIKSRTIKLSSISSCEEAYLIIEEIYETEPENKFAYKNNVVKVNFSPEDYNIYIPDNMEVIYILGKVNTADSGKLYKFALNGKDLGEKQHIESELREENICLVGNTLIYLKEDLLYINRHKVDAVDITSSSGSFDSGFEYLEDLNKVYYLNKSSDLMIKDMNKGESIKVDSSVRDFAVSESGEIFFTKSAGNKKYDIYTFIEDKVIKIAEDVNSYSLLSEKSERTLKTA